MLQKCIILIFYNWLFCARVNHSSKLSKYGIKKTLSELLVKEASKAASETLQDIVNTLDCPSELDYKTLLQELAQTLVAGYWIIKMALRYVSSVMAGFRGAGRCYSGWLGRKAINSPTFLWIQSIIIIIFLSMYVHRYKNDMTIVGVNKHFLSSTGEN